jgi:hypothetical protein
MGDTPVTCTATDASGNVATCGFTVSVQPLPVALCADKEVSAGAQCKANADVDSGSYDPKGGVVTKAQAPAGPYPLGNTSVVLTVTDSTNARATCNAVVMVKVSGVSPDASVTGSV